MSLKICINRAQRQLPRCRQLQIPAVYSGFDIFTSGRLLCWSYFYFPLNLWIQWLNKLWRGTENSIWGDPAALQQFGEGTEITVITAPSHRPRVTMHNGCLGSVRPKRRLKGIFRADAGLCEWIRTFTFTCWLSTRLRLRSDWVFTLLLASLRSVLQTFCSIGHMK